jgi:hypothetical protein
MTLPSSTFLYFYQTQLEQLEPVSIRCWGDLCAVFTGHFQGTYTHPRNSWDLYNYKKRANETL